MDFFDTDIIEGKSKQPINEHNISEIYNSKRLTDKLEVLKFLDSPQSNQFFEYIIEASNYPIASVHEEAYKLLLKWLPKKIPSRAIDKEAFETLVKKVMPWVNQKVASLNAGIAQNNQTKELETLVGTLNVCILNCLDYIADTLAPELINSIVLATLSFNNFNIQISACQVIKHFYLAVADKTILELADIFDVLLTNNAIGTKELKRSSLESMMAIYRVFGDSIEGFLEKLNSSEKIDQIKQGASQLSLRMPEDDYTDELSQEESVFSSSRQLNPAFASQVMPSKNSIKPTPAHGFTESDLNGEFESTQRMSSAMEPKRFERKTIMPKHSDQKPLNKQFGVNFDEFRDIEPSQILMGYDDKWCKKVQIMKKQEPIIEELTFLLNSLENAQIVHYYPEVNKNFLLLLKNLMISQYPKVVIQVFSVIRSLFRATSRALQDGFTIFYSELIEKLRSKSRQDEILQEALIFLSSNVSLPNFLRRIQKDFQEKSTSLRSNLIEVLVTILQGKDNYDESEIMRAGNAISDLKKFAETELAKDQSVAVRKSSQAIIKIIDSLYSDVLEISPKTRKSLPRGPRPDRNTVGGSSVDRSRISERQNSRGKNVSQVGGSTIAEGTFKPGPTVRPSIPTPKPASTLSVRLSALRDQKKERQSTLASSSSKSLQKPSRPSLTSHPGISLAPFDSQPSIPPLSSVGLNKSFSANMAILEAQDYSVKRTINKAQLGDSLEVAAQQGETKQEVDRFSSLLTKVKEELEPLALVSVVNSSYEISRLFSASLLRAIIPHLVIPSAPSDCPVFENLLANLLSFYGPIYFFETLENCLYEKDLFLGDGAEETLNIVQVILGMVEPTLHPISLILSIVRGFLYLHTSALVNSKLGELAYLLTACYGKDNFRYIRKDFELLGIKEKIIDTSRWCHVKTYHSPELVKRLEKVSFKEKILGEVKDLTPCFKAFQNGHHSQQSVRELLLITLRNFIYVVSDRENVRIIEYICDKLADGNIVIQKMSLQALAIHFNSAKTTFKFSQMMYANIFSLLRHNTSEIRFLALNLAYYLCKQDTKAYKNLLQEMINAPEEVQIEIFSLVARLMDGGKKFVKEIEPSLGVKVASELVTSKQQRLREYGKKLIEMLLTQYEKADLLKGLMKLHERGKRRLTEEAIERASAGKRAAKSRKASEAGQVASKLEKALDQGRFIVRDLHSINEEVAKCKSLRDLHQYTEKHLPPEITGLLFDVNSKKVMEGIRLLSEGLSRDSYLATKSFVLVAKLLNLLIEAETRPTEISTSMMTLLTNLVKLKKNAVESISKIEKWGLCEFLMVLFKIKFDKKTIQSRTKLVLSLFPDDSSKNSFISLMQKCDKRFYESYLASLKETISASGTGGSQRGRLGSGNSYRSSNFFDQEYDFSNQDNNQSDSNLERFRQNMADQSSIKEENVNDSYPDQISPERKAILGGLSGSNNQKATSDSDSYNENDNNLEEYASKTHEKAKSSFKKAKSHLSLQQKPFLPPTGPGPLQSPTFGRNTLIESHLLKDEDPNRYIKGANLGMTSPNKVQPQDKFFTSPGRGPSAQNDDMRSIRSYKSMKSTLSLRGDIKMVSTGDALHHPPTQSPSLFPGDLSHQQALTVDNQPVRRLSSTAKTVSSHLSSLLPTREVSSIEQAAEILAQNGLSGGLSDCIVYLRDAAMDFSLEDLQLLLPAINTFLENPSEEFNERVVGNIIEVLLDALPNIDPLNLSIRDVSRLVQQLFKIEPSLSARQKKRLTALENELFSTRLSEELYLAFLEDGGENEALLDSIYQKGIKKLSSLTDNFVETIKSFYLNNYSFCKHLEVIKKEIVSRNISFDENREEEIEEGELAEGDAQIGFEEDPDDEDEELLLESDETL